MRWLSLEREPGQWLMSRSLRSSSPYLEFDDYAVHRMPEDLQALHKTQEEEREPNVILRAPFCDTSLAS